MIPLALVLSGSGIGSILLWIIGVVVIFCIAFWILRAMGAPAVAFQILYVVAGLIALVLAIDFFFGGNLHGGGTINLR